MGQGQHLLKKRVQNPKALRAGVRFLLAQPRHLSPTILSKSRACLCLGTSCTSFTENIHDGSSKIWEQQASLFPVYAQSGTNATNVSPGRHVDSQAHSTSSWLCIPMKALGDLNLNGFLFRKDTRAIFKPFIVCIVSQDLLPVP